MLSPESVVLDADSVSAVLEALSQLSQFQPLSYQFRRLQYRLLSAQSLSGTSLAYSNISSTSGSTGISNGSSDINTWPHVSSTAFNPSHGLPTPTPSILSRQSSPDPIRGSQAFVFDSDANEPLSDLSDDEGKFVILISHPYL